MTLKTSPEFYKDHPINISAYLGFLNWATQEKTLIDQFKAETGDKIIQPAKGGLAQLIDEACGMPEHNIRIMKKFVVWVTENLWGTEEDTPSLFYEKFKETK